MKTGLSQRSLLMLGVILYGVTGGVAFGITSPPLSVWVVGFALQIGLVVLAWIGRTGGVWVLLVLALMGAVSQLLPPMEAWRLPLALSDLCSAVIFASVLRIRSAEKAPVAS